MNLRRDLPPILVATAVVAALGWLAWQPVATAHRLQDALAKRDTGLLQQDVDFDALRDSVRSEVSAAIQAWANDDRRTPEEALSAAFAGALVEPMTDMLVTPVAMSRMMAGSPPTTATDGETPASPAPDTSFAYEDLDTFTVSVRPHGSEAPPIVFVLHRYDATTWKLAAIRLPRDDIQPKSPAKTAPAGDSADDGADDGDSTGNDDATPDFSADEADADTRERAQVGQCMDRYLGDWRAENGNDAPIPQETLDQWEAICNQ